MLEIGNSLRTARGRQGLEFAQVDADTHIRMRYLKALEDERFDLLPGAAYARGFLRTYANYLGLNADLFVDEYNARFAPPEEAPPQLTPLGRTGAQRLRLRLYGTVGGLLALALAAVVAWRFGTEREPTTLSPAGNPVVSRAPPVPAQVPAKAHRRSRQATLVLTAARGPCWLLVRVGSSGGRSLYEGTLGQGESFRFAGRRLWMRLGAPQNLYAILNGEPADLPDDTANIEVTTGRIRVVARG